jgi:hypothetical protein
MTAHFTSLPRIAIVACLALAPMESALALPPELLEKCRIALSKMHFFDSPNKAVLGKEALARLQSASSHQERLEAFAAISPLSAEASFAVAEYLSQSEDPKTRAASADLMQRNNSSLSGKPLEKLLSDPVAEVRLAAIEALGKRFDVPPLVKLNQMAKADENTEVRKRAQALADEYDKDKLLRHLKESPWPPLWAYWRLHHQGIELSDEFLFDISKRVTSDGNFPIWLRIIVPRITASSPMMQWDQKRLIDTAIQRELPVMAHLAIATLYEMKATPEHFIKIEALAQFEGVNRAARAILSSSPNQLRNHTLYSALDGGEWDAFVNCKPLCFREFQKSGTRLFLVGGPLVGKAVIRVIPHSAAEAWEKALAADTIWKKAGFEHAPIERILTLEGISRDHHLDDRSSEAIKEFMRALTNERERAVVAEVVPGPSVGYLKSGYFLSAANQARLDAMMDKIRRVLVDEIGVSHDHDHPGNFVIKSADGEGITLIDLDQAFLKPKPDP